MGTVEFPDQLIGETGTSDRSDDPDVSPAPDAHFYRTVIVDDHELLRTGTRRILEEASGFTVVGEAADAESALEVVKDSSPDLVITDIRLPTANGIDLARRLTADRPALVVLILSAYDDEHYVRAAMAAGVAGYLLKTMPSAELVQSIRDACDGKGAMHGLSRGRGEKSGDGAAGSPNGRLTIREADVVRLVARGMPNKAIARQLGISTRTVEGHLNHVFEKIGIASRTELVHYTLANSLFARESSNEVGSTT